jgi:hypothetical protein
MPRYRQTTNQAAAQQKKHESRNSTPKKSIKGHKKKTVKLITAFSYLTHSKNYNSTLITPLNIVLSYFPCLD